MPRTVQSARSNFMKALRMSNELGISPRFHPIGPWDLGDDVGFTVALQLLKASQLKGNYSETNQEFDTIRRLRTVDSRLFKISGITVSKKYAKLTFLGPKGQVLSVTNSQTNSLLYERFTKGLLLRMGRDTRSDVGLDISILIEILKNLEAEIKSSPTSRNRRRWLVIVGAYLMLSYVCSLRGNEGFMLEQSDLINYINFGNEKGEEHPHVVFPLLGRFKGEYGERSHLLMSVSKTALGLEVRKRTEALVSLLKSEGHTGVGPAFCDSEGYLVSSRAMNDEFHNQRGNQMSIQ